MPPEHEIPQPLSVTVREILLSAVLGQHLREHGYRFGYQRPNTSEARVLHQFYHDTAQPGSEHAHPPDWPEQSAEFLAMLDRARGWVHDAGQ